MKPLLKNLLCTLLIPVICFLFILLAQRVFDTDPLVQMIFVLAVFLTSLLTDGIVWGILSSVIGVLAVNYAFTFPYFQFNFSIPANLFSALVMLSVAIITGTLTAKIKVQERMKAEADKERARSDLLRAISHDLRTPLTSISASCSAITENYERLSDAKKLKLLKEMGEDSEWLIRMVENLLSITRVGGGAVALFKTPIVLEELIDAVLIKFQKLHRGQAVEVHIPDRFIAVPMDAMLIEQVLLNLLENAVFHAAGMTHLSLSVYTLGNLAIFEVTDNGCGVTKEQLQTLFSGYRPGGNAPVDSGSRGMGIGLSVCAAIIQAHGGSIQADSIKGKGLTIRFSLEMEKEEEEEKEEKKGKNGQQ